MGIVLLDDRPAALIAFRMVAKAERSGNDTDFGRGPGQEASEQPSGGAPGGDVVDADKMLTAGGRMIGDQRHDGHPPVLQPVDGCLNLRERGRDHRDTVASRAVKNSKRTGHPVPVEGVDGLDMHMHAVTAHCFGVGQRFAGQVFHEGVGAIWNEEVQAVDPFLGKAGGKDIRFVVQRLDGLLDLFDGDLPDTRPPIEDTINRCQADTRCFGHIVDRYALHSSPGRQPFAVTPHRHRPFPREEDTQGNGERAAWFQAFFQATITSFEGRSSKNAAPRKVFYQLMITKLRPPGRRHDRTPRPTGN